VIGPFRTPRGVQSICAAAGSARRRELCRCSREFRLRASHRGAIGRLLPAMVEYGYPNVGRRALIDVGGLGIMVPPSIW